MYRRVGVTAWRKNVIGVSAYRRNGVKASSVLDCQSRDWASRGLMIHEEA